MTLTEESRKLWPNCISMTETEAISFKTKLAESIYYNIKNRKKQKVARSVELFQPGRMFYQWNWKLVDGKWRVEEFMPQNVVRSKQEVRCYESV